MRRFPPAGARAQAALVGLVAVATFANSLFNEFALDDNYIIRGNLRVHQLSDLGAIWLTPYWPTFGEYLGLYRPLAIFGYALQWAAGGGDPLVFHAVSVALHAAVSVLVLLLLRRFASPGAALLGALLFAVHPVHTEVVANGVGQAELIAAAGVLGACILHVSRTPDRGRPDVRRDVAIAALFLLALLAKEGAVVLPGLLIGLDAARGRVGFRRESVVRYAREVALPIGALLLALAGYFALRFHVLGSIGGVDAAPNLPFLRQEHRVFSALRAWPEYVRLLVWPFDLSADYSPGVILPATGFTPMVLLGTLLLAATAALALLTPAFPGAGAPAAWFLIAVFPVSNLALPIGVLLAERVLYLPSVAIAFVAAIGADRARMRAPARTLRLAAAAAVLLFVAFTARSVARNPDWKDTPAVWDALVRDHPESYRAQWVNGYRMRQRGDLDLATRYFEIAYRIWPDDAELLNNLGGVLIEQGRYAEAIPYLERSRALNDVLDRTELLVAFAYLTQERPAEALEAADRAARLGGDPAIVLPLRAQALERLGRVPEAIEAWQAGVRLPAGRTWTFWSMLARDLARTGRTDEALAAADSAAATAAGPRVIEGVARLRDAIRDGCYGPAPAGCPDPLADWAIVLPPAAQEIASKLQNARE